MATKTEQVDALLRAGKKTVHEIAEAAGTSDSFVYTRRKALRDAGELDGADESDEQGGGQDSDQSSPTTEQLLAWHVDREKELLERIGVLSERMCKLMDEVDQLRAAAAE
jgi:transposase